MFRLPNSRLGSMPDCIDPVGRPRGIALINPRRMAGIPAGWRNGSGLGVVATPAEGCVLKGNKNKIPKFGFEVGESLLVEL